MGLLDNFQTPQKQGGGLLGNVNMPLLMAGLSMMGSNRNPFQAGVQGLMGGLQYNRQQQQDAYQREQQKVRQEQAAQRMQLLQSQEIRQQQAFETKQAGLSQYLGLFEPQQKLPNMPQGDNPLVLADASGLQLPSPESSGFAGSTVNPQATKISQMFPNVSQAHMQVAASMPPQQGFQYLQQANKPKERGMFKGADGFNYYKDDLSRVLPNVKMQPKNPLVVNNMGSQESEQSKATGKALGSFYADNFISTQKRGSDSYAALPRLNRARQLLAGVDTGSLQPAAQTLKSIARDMGVNLESLGIRDDVPLADNLRVVAGEFVMDVVQQTKGSVSDKEMGMFEKMSFNLRNSPEGNMLILEMAEDLHKRNIEVAKIARNYRKENGGKLDDGLSDKLSEYYEANPMFTEDLLARIEGIEAPEPTATKVINGKTYFQRGNMWFSK